MNGQHKLANGTNGQHNPAHITTEQTPVTTGQTPVTTGQTPVKKLIKSVESVLNTYSEQLELMSRGKRIENPIDDKTIDTVIKIVKEMTHFENFDRIANPKSALKELESAQKPIDNMFEHVVRQVKKNGRDT